MPAHYMHIWVYSKMGQIIFIRQSLYGISALSTSNKQTLTRP